MGGIVRSELGTPKFLVLPFYYQLAATGLAFLVAISATATIVVSMNGLAKLQVAERAAGKRKASQVSGISIIMQEPPVHAISLKNIYI